MGHKTTARICAGRGGQTVFETQTVSMCLMPFPLPTGAVPKRWNIGVKHGRRCATPSLRTKGLDVRIDHRSYERQGVDLLPTMP